MRDRKRGTSSATNLLMFMSRSVRIMSSTSDLAQCNAAARQCGRVGGRAARQAQGVQVVLGGWGSGGSGMLTVLGRVGVQQAQQGASLLLAL